MKAEIPKGAMPVVEILRRDVPRPMARVVEDIRGVPRFECGKCPMGLHPDAMVHTPAVPESFRPGSKLGFLQHVPASSDDPSPGYVFWTWWDGLSLTDARAAVDLIWPQEAQQ